jgi:DUF3054 family protein
MDSNHILRDAHLYVTRTNVGRGVGAVTLMLMRVMIAAVLDVCCLAVFVAVGRASHDEAASIAGFATTAWPFLAGAVVGWVVTRAWRRPAAVMPTGLGVWLATVAVGMALRVLSGQSIAVTFVIVALVFLGAVLLGWRVVARWWMPGGRAPGGRALGGRATRRVT